MSYPKKVKLFTPWAKAMVAGATVDKPDYHGGKMSKLHKKTRRRKKRKRRKRKND